MFERMLGSGSVRQITLGGMTALAIYVAGAGLTACAQLLVARVVGAETFGIYSYVLAWVTVLAYLSALGFDIALLRFIPAYRAQQAWALLRGVARYAQRRMAAASALVVATGATAVMLSSAEMSPELRTTFLIGFVLVPIWALLWIRSSIGRAFGGVLSAIGPDRVARDGCLICLVVLMSAVLKWHLDAPLVMAATVVSTTVALALASLAVRRLRPQHLDAVAPCYDAPAWRKIILPLMTITAAEAMLNRGGVLALGWTGAAREAGIYAVVFNISFLVALPRTAANTLLAPSISDLFVRNQHHQLQSLLARMALWTFCGAAGCAIAVAVIAEPLLAWFGRGYEAGVPALRILLIGQVIAASCGSQLSIMTMTGCERAAAVLLVVGAVVNVLLSTVLVRFAGLTGAGIATMLTLIAWNVAMAIFIWHRLRLLPGPVFLLQALLKGHVVAGSPTM
ncbi:MAG: oligosaccharide flippase family protein [Pseudomonadota bacterium]